MFQKFWKKVQHLWLWAAGEAGGAAAGWLAMAAAPTNCAPATAAAPASRVAAGCGRARRRASWPRQGSPVGRPQ
jgi:hypothetical protein